MAKQVTKPGLEITPELFTTVHNLATMSRVETEVIDLVSNGNINPLKVLMSLHDMKKSIEAIEKAIKKTAVTEAEKHGKGTHTMYGRSFQVMEAGTQYDYTISSRWVDMKEAIKEIEGKLKVGWIDTDTGEELKARKSSTTTIRISK